MRTAGETHEDHGGCAFIHNIAVFIFVHDDVGRAVGTTRTGATLTRSNVMVGVAKITKRNRLHRLLDAVTSTTLHRLCDVNGGRRQQSHIRIGYRCKHETTRRPLYIDPGWESFVLLRWDVRFSVDAQTVKKNSGSNVVAIPRLRKIRHNLIRKSSTDLLCHQEFRLPVHFLLFLLFSWRNWWIASFYWKTFADSRPRVNKIWNKLTLGSLVQLPVVSNFRSIDFFETNWEHLIRTRNQIPNFRWITSPSM